MDKIYKVGAYIRLSKEDEKKGKGENSNSVDNQIILIKQCCQTHPEYKLIETYIDDGISGLTFERESFKRLMNDIKKKKIDLCIVKDMTRFGRDLSKTITYADLVLEYGADILTVSGHKFWSKDRHTLQAQLELMMGNAYSFNISTKVLETIKVKRIKGDFIGAYPSYGYSKSSTNKNKLEIDPYPAEIVKRIFNEFIAGKAKLAIAKDLNKDGILPPALYKIQHNPNYRNPNKLDSTTGWTYSTINKILHQKIYTGNMVQGKRNHSKFAVLGNKKSIASPEEIIEVENTHEAIISKETWEITQDLLKRNTRAIDFTTVNLFAGFLKCGKCQKALVFTKWNEKRCYICSKYKSMGKELGCTRHSVDEYELKELIVNELNYRAKQYQKEINKHKNDIEQKNEQKQNRTNEKKINNLKKIIDNEFKKISSASLAHSEGIMQTDDYLRIIDEYNSLKANIEKEIHSLSNENINKPKINEKLIEQLLNAEFKPETLTREILSTYINKIIVNELEDGDTSIQIIWKFAELS